jgi:hypothetical protein
MMVKTQQNSTAKNDCSQLTAGLSFQEYVPCDNNIVTCEVQTSEQIMDENFISDVSKEEEEEEGREGENE